MKAERFSPTAAGTLVATLQGHLAFVPDPLPPAIDLHPVNRLIEEASVALGDLKGAGRRLPNPLMLLRPFLRREAVLSSRIEGTQTSFSDLVLFEASAEAPGPVDRTEVINYIRAVEHGLASLSTLPLSLRLCRELHAVLMGQVHFAGNFRTEQNWIGSPGCTVIEASYVPPPVDLMHERLNDWERYLHDTEHVSTLVQAAVMHYQFEAIHPFQDGNGRVGRLMIALFLAERGLMPQPLLYLSAFFERHRSDYYELLMSVSTKGEWLPWIEFFLRGVRTQSLEAASRIEALLSLQDEYRAKVPSKSKGAGSLLKLIDALFVAPAITGPTAMKILQMTFPAAQQNIEKLIEMGILREVTGQERNRIYLAPEIHRRATEDLES
ncbi:MAG: Fic family protein [Labilithrix sp.]|nr:Fic family protein [Labilithrix sp.]